MREQQSLLGSATTSNTVAWRPTPGGWLRAAEWALQAGQAPEQLHWQRQSVLSNPGYRGELPLTRSAIADNDAFKQLLSSLVFHRDADSADLLYRLLWRVHRGEQWLLEDSTDEQVRLANTRIKSVHRDIHKMKAFLRFNKLETDAPEALAADEQFIAWFEPEHLILRPASRFFHKRFYGMRWSIFTPEGSAHWRGEGKLQFLAPELSAKFGVDPRAINSMNDDSKALWHSYFKSTFNPARLKIKAMHAEMPQKYWKNLPESHYIGNMILGAQQRSDEMIEREANEYLERCGPRPPRVADRSDGEISDT